MRARVSVSACVSLHRCVTYAFLGAGHAYHTYQLTSPDGTVALELKHNVNGREVYCEGTVDAVEFLAAQVRNKSDKHVWSMLDILGAGAMQ